MEIISFGLTKQGTDHAENEDSILIDNIRNLYAIADGVTIPEGGKKASFRAVNYLERFFDGDLKRTVKKVGAKLLEDKSEISLGYTTLVAAAVNENSLQVANVGDTPAFLVRDDEIVMLTVQDRFFDSLSQALGQPKINIHATEERLKLNDCIMLASDGITNILTEEEILEIVKSHKDPKEIVEATFIAAEEEPHEYNDDKTMIVLKISE